MSATQFENDVQIILGAPCGQALQGYAVASALLRRAKPLQSLTQIFIDESVLLNVFQHTYSQALDTEKTSN